MQKQYSSFGMTGVYPARASGRVTSDQLDWYCKVSHDANPWGIEWFSMPEANKATVRASVTAVLEELGFSVW